MRLFIALELPEEVKCTLVAVRRAMQQTRPVRWVAPHAMHLTLVFLGETNPNLLPALSTALHATLANQAPLTLATTDVGAFPSVRRPQVLWVGVGGETEALATMHQQIVAALVPLGFPRETRPFTAHLTLGRIARNATAAEQAAIRLALQAAPTPPHLTWQAETVTLFESQLLPAGPSYTVRDTIPLQSN